ncbi:DsbA family protein [Vibrio splendidus]|uniref:DsbA family protein n=1 Tax=Vibrio splendidus TaxID=29497 RepID=UPI0002DEFD6C|nr:DsbA family protein [Vibrio splendidus]OEF26247.1 thioredoxin [Vibrio splendidus 1S-124]PTP89050.1 DsbA family protein [Vibrio splendidus]PTQ20632.1 DsbA family protein [Vibrio splendidus]
MDVKLHYVHDPMCSWCWGYKPTLELLKQQLPASIEFNYVVGGLAPDSEDPMSEEMKGKLQAIWKQIEAKLGTEFNHEFWTECQPVRSTYPACRAVIAAGFQDHYEAMLEAIQHAYYLRAMLPHSQETHLQLAEELGMNVQQFENDLSSKLLESEFDDQLGFKEAIGVHSYPTLMLEVNGIFTAVELDYHSTEATLKSIREVLVNNAPAA